MVEKSRLTFRISLWRPWLLALTVLALPAALGVALSVVGGKLAAAQAILLVFAGVAVALLLPIGFAVWASAAADDSRKPRRVKVTIAASMQAGSPGRWPRW